MNEEKSNQQNASLPALQMSPPAPKSSKNTKKISSRTVGRNKELEHIFTPAFEASWVYCTHDTPRCVSSIKIFESNNELPPPIERAQLAQYIQRQRLRMMMKGDYEEAEKYYQLGRKFAKACQADTHNNTQNNQSAIINCRINDINFTISEIIQKWEDAKEDKIQDTKYKIEELKIQLKEDLKEFDEKYSTVDALRKYESPSPELIELQKKEQKLVLIKEFAEAEKTHKIIEEMELEETQKAQERAESDIFLKRQKIIDRYNENVTRLKDHTKRQIAAMESNKERDIRAMKIRLEKLQTDKNKGNFREPLQSSKVTTPAKTQIPMAVTTPRTRAKLLSYKRQPPVRKLKIAPISSNRPVTAINTRMYRLQ